ncbi:hypothetical protein BDV39DRAFT_178363 [Aspergillus sergii]|uniref:Uncharacterized protein n=1 Tax=Aspergillus sergii TaxID=1034303 RepID=A0A5N6WZT7_9EURO|nr:hypothetical protein BDV39DRAFT_178363 [Aspergillus sergii]
MTRIFVAPCLDEKHCLVLLMWTASLLSRSPLIITTTLMMSTRVEKAIKERLPAALSSSSLSHPLQQESEFV